MTIADNAVSLCLLEGLCAELRSRLEPQIVTPPRFLERLNEACLRGKTIARVLAILSGTYLTAVFF
ncbi:hypothetical protein SH661x_000627 [Planctomicrobium sp. SH661]|uniref:hypothetical protein n=1 Tax=Planctomicrobium sp. SH661 TaxID=3448124 RepID=UPI003F5B1F7E